MTFLPLNFTLASVDSKLWILLALAVAAVIFFVVKRKKNAQSGSEEAVEPVEAVAEATVAAESTDSAAVVAENAEEESALPYTPGYVTLDGVAEQDAAVIMAITSYKTGIALERLAFRSIKRLNQDPVLENISEQDAAVIMAITSDKTGIPLEKLSFNSIKLVEE